MSPHRRDSSPPRRSLSPPPTKKVKVNIYIILTSKSTYFFLFFFFHSFFLFISVSFFPQEKKVTMGGGSVAGTEMSGKSGASGGSMIFRSFVLINELITHNMKVPHTHSNFFPNEKDVLQTFLYFISCPGTSFIQTRTQSGKNILFQVLIIRFCFESMQPARAGRPGRSQDQRNPDQGGN